MGKRNAKNNKRIFAKFSRANTCNRISNNIVKATIRDVENPEERARELFNSNVEKACEERIRDIVVCSDRLMGRQGNEWDAERISRLERGMNSIKTDKKEG